ncbi:hypothetical protein NKR19_g6150 [Coniochaeta hoffmannii]|uniref:P-loop containing nucleoside triphosphate hydrolase protein n=1 Tax=Coniochaeta hoffmannii TaxID=91930 RepID=A0AA38S1Z6_9PEZI|nr:hypothetical protein NKR19_g6150 [Coniochaeta hoffmannii]
MSGQPPNKEEDRHMEAGDHVHDEDAMDIDNDQQPSLPMELDASIVDKHVASKQRLVLPYYKELLELTASTAPDPDEPVAPNSQCGLEWAKINKQRLDQVCPDSPDDLITTYSRQAQNDGYDGASMLYKDGQSIDTAMQNGQAVTAFSNPHPSAHQSHGPVHDEPGTTGDLYEASSDDEEPEFTTGDLFEAIDSLIKSRWISRYWDGALAEAIEVYENASCVRAYKDMAGYTLRVHLEKINRNLRRFVIDVEDGDDPEDETYKDLYVDGVERAAHIIRVLGVFLEDEVKLQLLFDVTEDPNPEHHPRPTMKPINDKILATIKAAEELIANDLRKELEENRGFGSEKTGQLNLATLTSDGGKKKPTGEYQDFNDESDDDSGSRSGESEGPVVDYDIEDVVAGFNSPDIMTATGPDETQTEDDLQELTSDEFARLYAPETEPERERFQLYTFKEGSSVYVPPNFRATILEHQIAGVRFMWKRLVGDQSGALLLHSPGLGKTFQVMVLLASMREATMRLKSELPQKLRKLRVVIVCPAGLVSNWMKEHRNLTCHDKLPFWSLTSDDNPAVRGDTLTLWRTARTGGVLVTSWGILQRISKYENEWDFMKQRTTLLIIDEVHELRNVNNKHGTASEFTTSARIGLTGTPIANTLMDFFHIADWAVKDHGFGTQKNFIATVIQRMMNDGTRAAAVASYLAKTSLVAHRMTLEKANLRMPRKTEFYLSLALKEGQVTKYNKELARYQKDQRDKENKPNYFAFSNRCSLLLAHPHIFDDATDAPEIINLDSDDEDGQDVASSGAPSGAGRSRPLPYLPTRDALAKFTNQSTKTSILLRILDVARTMRESVLVFSRRITTLNFLRDLCKQHGHDVFYLDGNVRPKDRQKSIDDFREKIGPSVFLLSTAAACVGINLQRATRVVIFDFAYSPEVEEVQAIARAYRMGQEKHVFVYWLTMATTMETFIRHISKNKRHTANVAFDPRVTTGLSTDQLDRALRPASIPDSDYCHVKFKGVDELLDQLVQTHGNHILQVVDEESIQLNNSFELLYTGGSSLDDPLVV